MEAPDPGITPGTGRFRFLPFEAGGNMFFALRG